VTRYDPKHFLGLLSSASDAHSARPSVHQLTCTTTHAMTRTRLEEAPPARIWQFSTVQATTVVYGSHRRPQEKRLLGPCMSSASQR
jgi:hypothetical protein